MDQVTRFSSLRQEWLALMSRRSPPSFFAHAVITDEGCEAAIATPPPIAMPMPAANAAVSADEGLRSAGPDGVMSMCAN